MTSRACFPFHPIKKHFLEQGLSLKLLSNIPCLPIADQGLETKEVSMLSLPPDCKKNPFQCQSGIFLIAKGTRFLQKKLANQAYFGLLFLNRGRALIGHALSAKKLANQGIFDCQGTRSPQKKLANQGYFFLLAHTLSSKKACQSGVFLITWEHALFKKSLLVRVFF